MKFKIVLTGGPRSGKTTTLNALTEMLDRDIPFHFIKEQTTEYNNAQVAADPEFKPFADLVTLNREVTKMQIEEEDKAAQEHCILDRSLIDDIAISKLLKVGEASGQIIHEEIHEIVKKRKPYDLVFILDRVKIETHDKTIRNTNENGDEQHVALLETYAQYIPQKNIIQVPVIPILDRAKLIYSHIKKFMAEALVTENETKLSATKLGLFSPKTMPTQSVAVQPNFTTHGM